MHSPLLWALYLSPYLSHQLKIYFKQYTRQCGRLLMPCTHTHANAFSIIVLFSYYLMSLTLPFTHILFTSYRNIHSEHYASLNNNQRATEQLNGYNYQWNWISTFYLKRIDSNSKGIDWIKIGMHRFKQHESIH